MKSIHDLRGAELGTALRGRRVLVVGLGKSGLAAARLLNKKKARVFITDQRSRADLKDQLRRLPSGVRVEAGSHQFLSRKFDLIVVSPGVDWNHAALKKARKNGVPVWPELELGWRFVKPRQTVAVTGTNGKTTTTALVAQIVKQAGRPVVCGGNIGTPLSDLIGEVTPRTTLVLEVSSYQLEAHQTFHPDVGVLLNITPDHLARHSTMERYAKAKARLFANAATSDTAVLNKKNAWCRRIGRTLSIRKSWFPSDELRLLALATPLLGEHNLENAMAAAAAGLALGLKASVIRQAIRSFRGVPHRLEPVTTINGVLYVNDSKATNVDSTVVAVKAIKPPLILILGGEHKGAPYTPLKPYVKRKVKEILTIGEAGPLIQKDLKGSAPIVPCGTLEKAVHHARETARKGDTVLLSPACASFDQYRNFEHRGQHFAKLVRKIAQ